MPDFELSSSAFDAGQPIPRKYTCEGENAAPPLSWSSPPDGTRSLALIVHDPDAPSGDFVHWVAWNIDPAAGGLEEGAHAPGEGVSGFGENGYAGPCPPPGHGAHRYFHELFALDTEVDLPEGASREQLEDAIDGHVLGATELVGTYERT
jgi:Raf kinase inhibitor-like YbhB/YbcL family protein